MAAFKDLFGDVLLKQEEKVDTQTHLEGKHVLIYFSAHWCPPCRGFTPQLATFYKEFQQTSSTPFEIVFASSDRDEEAFNEYYDEMPWTALPYSERELKEKLSQQFKVQGIPTLVVLDPQGELITSKGRASVSSDPTGSKFPWRPRTLFEVLEDGEQLKSADGDVDPASLRGKYFAIYFSAHWCPPCRRFTPILADVYKKLKAQGKPFEVVFASCDREEDQFNEYFAEMPWLTLGFKDKRVDELNDLLDVSGIPQLTLIDENGKIVTNEGTAFVNDDLEGADFPWTIKPLQKIGFCTSVINDEPCILGLFPNKDETAVALLKDMAEANSAAAEAKTEQRLHYFYNEAEGGEVTGITNRIVELFQLDATKPTIALVNIPKGGYSTCTADKEAITALVESFQSGNLELTSISHP